MKITKCDEENKVILCKDTGRATGPKPATYGDEDKSEVSYAELFGLMGRRLLVF
jgi:hypothetical protein